MKPTTKEVKLFAQDMIHRLQLLIDIADNHDYHIYGIGICTLIKMDADDLMDMVHRDAPMEEVRK